MSNEWDEAMTTIMPLTQKISAGLADIIRATKRQKNTQIQVGAELRRLRVKRGISLRSMAIQLGVAAPFLSDMERGNRNWTFQRAEKFLSILKNK